MIYEINHSCGHVESVQIYGTNVHGERDRKVAYLESQPCKECRRAAAAEANAAAGMSSLSGSPKQVAWAEEIRAEASEKVRAAMERQISEGERAGMPAEQIEAARGLLDGTLHELGMETSAAWWIDEGRGMSADALGQRFAKMALSR